MIRFMLCDVNTGMLEHLAAALHQQFDPCSVEFLPGPDALEVALREDAGSADILITEIELHDRNAIDIISTHLKYSSSLRVIYMASRMDYWTDVYETPHCDYLLKPISQQRLVQAVKRAMRSLGRKHASGIMIQKGNSIHVVEMESVIYIQNHARIIRIVTDDGPIEVYNTIERFLYQLDNRFVQCHKSYAVNMERVKEYCVDRFLLENDIVIPISQSKRKEVRERYHTYLSTAVKH